MKKKRQRRLFRRLKQLASFAMGLIVAYGIYWLWASPVWYWHGQMTISGNRLVSKEEILSKLNVPANTALFRINPQWVSNQLGSMPTISKVAVRRWLFPPRLELTVLERQPLVSVMAAGGNWWMDQEGVVFTASPQLVTPRFPIKVQTALKVGDRLPASVQANLFDLLSTWPKGGKGLIDMRKLDDVQATVDGWPLRLGPVSEIPIKFGVFEHLKPLAQKYKDRLQYIDLRFPTSPTFKLQSGDEIAAQKAAPKPEAKPASPAPSPSPGPSQSPAPEAAREKKTPNP